MIPRIKSRDRANDVLAAAVAKAVMIDRSIQAVLAKSPPITPPSSQPKSGFDLAVAGVKADWIVKYPNAADLPKAVEIAAQAKAAGLKII